MTPRHLLIALAIVVVWGVNFVALDWSVAEVPPFLVTAARFFFAAVPAVFFIRPPKVSAWLVIAYGLAVGALQFGLMFTALRLGMPAGLASLVMQTQAFFTFGLAVLLLGERPGLFQIGGGIIAFAGIGVIALERLEGTALLPLLLTVAAAFFWGASNIITKKAGKVDNMVALVVWGALVPVLPMLLLSLLFEGADALPQGLMHLTWRGGGGILFSAYVSTLFGYGMWSVLLGKYPANTVAPMTLLVPIFGFGSTYLLLSERITGYEIAGAVLIFLGLLVSVFGPILFRRISLA
jgi:O-acetylserine/cysteine efflux transporter